MQSHLHERLVEGVLRSSKSTWIFITHYITDLELNIFDFPIHEP